MPTFVPQIIPTKAPGTIYSSLNDGDPHLNIRWLQPLDPAFYETLNRPMKDIAMRQLVMAKAIDALSMSQGHVELYPYILQPRVSSDTTQIEIPPRWIWDMHASLPKKWENLRLAKIKRISGENSPTDGYTGHLRLIFTANQQGSSTEVAIFSADYNIGSFLTYQPVRLAPATTLEEPVAIDSSETETVAGFLLFRTMDTDDQDVQALLDLLAPPSGSPTIDSDGYYDSPAVYEIADSPAGGAGVSDDVAVAPISHGTGLLIDSAWNPIPNLDAEISAWVETFNYPFANDANLLSLDGITIPRGLFSEFDITAPAGEGPVDDTSGSYYPVWVNRIEKTDDTGMLLRFYFATHNVTDVEAGGTPSTAPVEFGTLDLPYSSSPGDVLPITPINNLLMQEGPEAGSFNQHFGRGHVTLSDLWNKTTDVLENFYNSFLSLTGTPTDTIFTISSSRISAYGASRVPKYVPTVGQSRALAGSSARRQSPIYPSNSNRYVTESDQGVGDQIDLEAQSSITPNAAIDKHGYTGGLLQRTVRLDVDATQVGDNPNFYENEIEPRLALLLGRDPIFGDQWYNGTRVMFFNGDTWMG